MTVEAILTREIGITFIDARKFVTEAKLQLGIKGYPNKEQQTELVELAKQSFYSKSEELQKAMQVKKVGLESAKVLTSSHHSISLSNHTVSTSPEDVSDEFNDFENDSLAASSVHSRNGREGKAASSMKQKKKVVPGIGVTSLRTFTRSMSIGNMRRTESFGDASAASSNSASSSSVANTMRRVTSVSVCSSSIDGRSQAQRDHRGRKKSFTRPPKPASFSGRRNLDVDSLLFRGLGAGKKHSPSSPLNCTWE